MQGSVENAATGSSSNGDGDVQLETIADGFRTNGTTTFKVGIPQRSIHTRDSIGAMQVFQERLSGLFRPSESVYTPRWDKMDAYDPEFQTEGTGRRVMYNDFTTIDWIHDTTKERVRQRQLRSIKSLRGVYVRALDVSQGWIVVALIGILTGLLAGYINISSEWLSDLKGGFCTEGYYLNEKFCCWLADGNACSDWRSWSESLGLSTESYVGWGIDYVFFIFWATLFGILSGLLVKNYAPYAAGSGIPEVKTILGGFVIRKFLGFWTLVTKCIGLALSVASGMALGKEGPLVHVACSLGNIIPRVFQKYATNEAKKREILSAASAAGVSVAFGAPIGGVLFSLEEVSYYFPYKTMWRSFFCAMVAALSLQLVNPFRTGKLVLFQVEYKRNWHVFELPFFILLGILGGLYGAMFIKLNLRYAAFRKRSWLREWPLYEVGIIALVTAILSYPFHFARANSSLIVANLFKECEEVETDFHGLCNPDLMWSNAASLLFTATLKIILTIATFGIKIPAGIFIPSMVVGASFGRILGIFIHAWHVAYPSFWLFQSCVPDEQCVTPGTYAMVGAAAALAGVTRMTVSLTVIMFELTGALTYVLPIMLTVMCANWVGNAFGREGIYDGLIRLNGYPFLDTKEEYINNASASNIMTRIEDLDVITVTGHTVDSLEELVWNSDYQGFPVVSSTQEMQLVGYAGKSELIYALHSCRERSDITGSTPCLFLDEVILETPTSPILDLRPWIDSTPFTIHPKFPVEMVLELFKKMGLRYILITRNGQLHGLVTKKDVLRHLNFINHPSSDPTEPLNSWIRATG